MSGTQKNLQNYVIQFHAEEGRNCLGATDVSVALTSSAVSKRHFGYAKKTSAILI